MRSLKNKILTVLIITLLIITIPSLRASATTFDNSQFESELTSEEIAEEELIAKKEDKEAYLANKENSYEYANFYGLTLPTNNDTLHLLEESIYKKITANTNMSEEEKNIYLNYVIGDSTTDGLTDNVMVFAKKLEEYNENSDVIIDCTEANLYLEQLGFPSPSVNTYEYLQAIENIITNTPSMFTTLGTKSTTEERQSAARESNIIFTYRISSLQKSFEYYSVPQIPITSRLMNTPVLMNIGLLVGAIVLFVIRFPIVKKQQLYAWDKFKPLTLLVIPAVAVFFFFFFSYILGSNMSIESVPYSVYIDGKEATTSDRLYINEVGTHEIMLVSSGEDMSTSSTTLTVEVNETGESTLGKQDLEVTKYGDKGIADFTTEKANKNIALTIGASEYDYYTLQTLIDYAEVVATDNFEPDSTTLPYYITTHRDKFILPYSIVFISPALLFGVMFFSFMLMPGPMVKTYLNELYTINKFCGFLSYNMAYRNNARVLVEETLQSLETCKFAEDFAIIFFEKDRDMTDKLQDVTQIYNYKFFEMYLGIVSIIFDEGVSESTLKSLSIIQQFGDEYYNQADLFFKSKKGARSSLMMIIGICLAMPLIVKMQTSSLFLLFANTDTGYQFTIGIYIVWFGLICLIFNMYKNNKIVRKEGRYA